MYQLGNSRFEGVKGFDALSVERGAEFAYHNSVGAKPKTQRVGDKLEKLSLTIRFNAAFCTPEDELDNLEYSRRVGIILGLVSGDGRYYGDFLIETLRYTVERQLPNDGGMLSLLVNLELVEYFYQDRAAAKRRMAKASAFARPGVARPFPKTPASSISREKALMNRVTQIGGTVGRIATLARQAATSSGRQQYLFRELARQSGQLISQTDSTRAFINGNPNTIEGGGFILQSLGGGSGESFASAGARLAAFAASGNAAGVSQSAGVLGGLAAKLKTASQTTATAVATGKTKTGGQ